MSKTFSLISAHPEPAWDGIGAAPAPVKAAIEARARSQAALNSTLGLRAFAARKIVQDPSGKGASIVHRETLYVGGPQDLAAALTKFVAPTLLNDRWLDANAEGLWRGELRLATSGALSLNVASADMRKALEADLLQKAIDDAQAEARRARLFNLCEQEPDWAAIRTIEIVGLRLDGESLTACAQAEAEWFEVHALLDDRRRVPVMQVDTLYDADETAERMVRHSCAVVTDAPGLERQDEDFELSARQDASVELRM